MKKTTSFGLPLFICLVLLCQKPFATNAGQFYLGLDVGSSSLIGDAPKSEPAFIPNQEFNDSASAYGLHAGFQFNDWFAAEFGLTDFGSTSQRFKLREDIFFLVQPNDTQTVDAKGAYLSGVFSRSVTRSLSLIGFVGITTIDFELSRSGGYSPFTGKLSQKDSSSEQGLVYGVGVRYALNDSYGLRAEMHRSEVGDFTIDLLELGLEYSF